MDILGVIICFYSEQWIWKNRTNNGKAKWQIIAQVMRWLMRGVFLNINTSLCVNLSSHLSHPSCSCCLISYHWGWKLHETYAWIEPAIGNSYQCEWVSTQLANQLFQKLVLDYPSYKDNHSLFHICLDQLQTNFDNGLGKLGHKVMARFLYGKRINANNIIYRDGNPLGYLTWFMGKCLSIYVLNITYQTF